MLNKLGSHSFASSGSFHIHQQNSCDFLSEYEICDLYLALDLLESQILCRKKIYFTKCSPACILAIIFNKNEDICWSRMIFSNNFSDHFSHLSRLTAMSHNILIVFPTVVINEPDLSSTTQDINGSTELYPGQMSQEPYLMQPSPYQCNFVMYSGHKF